MGRRTTIKGLQFPWHKFQLVWGSPRKKNGDNVEQSDEWGELQLDRTWGWAQFQLNHRRGGCNAALSVVIFDKLQRGYQHSQGKNRNLLHLIPQINNGKGRLRRGVSRWISENQSIKWAIVWDLGHKILQEEHKLIQIIRILNKPVKIAWDPAANQQESQNTGPQRRQAHHLTQISHRPKGQKVHRLRILLTQQSKRNGKKKP